MRNSEKASLCALAILASVTLVALPAQAIRNLARLQGMRQLSACLDLSNRSAVANLWAKPSYAGCSQQISAAAGEDIAAVAAWLNGKDVPTDKLMGLQPEERQQVFVWRNDLSRGKTSPETNGASASLFVAQLAVYAWNQQQWLDYALWLSEQAMKGQGKNQVVRLLDTGVGLHTAEDAVQATQLRRQIAQAMPDYVDNYANWFEVMVIYRQWSSAAEACRALQERARPPYESLAAVCAARLAFYQDNYQVAHDMLLQTAAQRPQDSQVLTWFGIATRWLGRYAEAEKIFRQAMHYEQNPVAFLNLYWQMGDCQLALGRTDEALASYQTAIHYAPDDSSRRYHQDFLAQIRVQVQKP